MGQSISSMENCESMYSVLYTITEMVQTTGCKMKYSAVSAVQLLLYTQEYRCKSFHLMSTIYLHLLIYFSDPQSFGRLPKHYNIVLS